MLATRMEVLVPRQDGSQAWAWQAMEDLQVAPDVTAALLLGQGRPDQQTREDFRRAGLLHVLAVSGLHVGLVLAGTALIALAARVSIGWPVPMTLQTLAVLVVGFTYGARLGTVTLVTYLAQGAVGLPVFAGGNAGLVYMTGATGGFLLGSFGVHGADPGV